MELTLKKNTVAELMRLSPEEKREAAAWLRREAREQEGKNQGPGDEGSTVAEATAALEALRSLDKYSRGLVIEQVRREDGSGEEIKPDFLRMILSKLLEIWDEDLLEGLYYGVCTSHRVQKEREEARSDG